MFDSKHTRNPKIEILQLGIIGYQEAWGIQTRYFEKILAIKQTNLLSSSTQPTPNYLLFCEHPPVFTMGRTAKPEHLLLNERQLAEKGASVHKINRGGDITFHGPGQIVAYPILDLENYQKDVNLYLRALEQAMIDTLSAFNIPSQRIEGLTGVWSQEDPPQKLGAIGIHLSRWVTMHGLALNVNTDLTFFDYIVPCGIKDKTATSMQALLGAPQDLSQVIQALEKNLCHQFRMKPTSQAD